MSGFPGGSVGKESACSAGELSLIPGLGRSPGEENSNPLQYSCLENSMVGEAWWLQSISLYTVVLGNEAASLSDPCPHGQAALKSVE